jgi:hypothetical protein
MVSLTASERQLLKLLAEAGKPTELREEDVIVGKFLERRGLVFFVQDSAFAIVTPKGRHALEEAEPSPNPQRKPPLGFLE